MSKAPAPTPAQIEQICKALGDTNNGLTGSEIGRMLADLGIADVDPTNTKWKRLYNALADRANRTGKTTAVYGLVRYCFDPVHGLNNTARYRWMMAEANKVLMLSGIEVRDDGQFHKIQVAKTLSEVEHRTKSLRRELLAADAHPDVLKCCNEELLAKDYFHAVHEAAKGLCKRVQSMTGLDQDGTRLFDTAFNIKQPYLILADLETESGRNQQNGLREMLSGTIHLIRNPTAHELRIRWDVNEKDAVGALTLISYLHKMLDQCTVIRRAN